MTRRRITILAAMTALPGAMAVPPALAEDDWAPREAPILAGHIQLTFPDRFTRAGEAYFSPDAARIIFQATPVPSRGEPVSPHYSMYVADVRRDADGRVTAIGEPLRISPDGSANTCGWFHPADPSLVLFGSTMIPPSDEDVPGYQRGSGRYRWAFPPETNIVTVRLPDNLSEGVSNPSPMFERDGYDAEASWHPNGRSVLYTRVDTETGDANIWVHDTEDGSHTELVSAPGYDGGPFFSPCGTRITYRSDREGNNLLQVFIAELTFDDLGRPDGIQREIQITDDDQVNWAPYWHPSGDYLVYATSTYGHRRYEIVATTTDPDLTPDQRPVVRITNAAGFDGLPVFSPDGHAMMWTSQRGPMIDGEDRPSSQLWIANFDAEALADALRRAAPAE